MRFTNKNNLIIKSIVICLLIGVSACSKEADKIVNVELEKSNILREHIRAVYKKYLELDRLQKQQKEDVTTQLNSISCALIRLTKIKFNLPPSDNVELKNRLENLGFLEISDEKKSDFFRVKIIRKYNYRNDYEYRMSGIEKHTNCFEYYQRIIPKSEEAKNLETKEFQEEIDRATKRLKSFPRRFEILEKLASEATTCQSFLQKSLDEYLVDKTPTLVEDGIKKYTECATKIDEGVKKINDEPEIVTKKEEVSSWWKF